MFGGNAKLKPGSTLEIAKQGAEMKEEGANQTQIRAFLEENGWSDIQFLTDDKGAPGVAPKVESGPVANHSQMNRIIKLVTEIMESNFLPGIVTKALKDIKLQQIGGSPGTCYVFAFQNEKYELDVVYYPSEETYAVCITSLKDRFDAPKLGERVTFDKLKDMIHDTVLKYIF